MRLYVIRHGETQWNKEHRLAGRTDVLLNKKGIKLAESTAEGLNDVKFDLCISSPLARALETARIVLNKREVPIICDEGLIEISFGDYEGRVCQDDDRNILMEEYASFRDDPFGFNGMPNGESIRDVIKRAGKTYNTITQNSDYQDKTLLISTHGCFYRAFLNSIYDDPNDFWQGGVPRNCAVSIVDVNNGKAKILKSDVIYYDMQLALRDF